MKINKFTRRLASAAAALLFATSTALPALAEAQPAKGAAIKLPGYFQQIIDNQDIEVACTAKRDDLGIELSCAPVHVNEYAHLLTDLKLTAAPKGGKLGVKAPFTLRFTYKSQTDTFSFSAQGVRYNGGLYLPGKPAALEAFYEEDWEKTFSATYYRLGQDMDFSAEQVASVDLNRSHYSDDISMHLTAKEPIAALLDEQKQVYVRKIENGEDIPVSVGGSAIEVVYTLNDGTVFRYGDSGGVTSLQRGAQETVTYQTLRGQNSRQQFDTLMDNYKSVPQLTVALNGKEADQVYQTSFRYGGETKDYQNEVPMEFGFDKHAYLPIHQNNTGKLTFSAAASQVSAQLFKPEGDKKGASQAIVVAKDGTLPLPGEPGSYYITIHAVFPKGSADYFFGFTVSDLPEFFDDISYGNESGGVTVTRDDLGRSVTGGQNRQYVQLLQALDLVPGDGVTAWPASQVKKPFTLTFRCEGYSDQKFQFQAQDSRVLYNGKVYRARNDRAILDFYTPAGPMEGDGLFEDTKGFLSAELTTFGALYPIRAQDVSSIKEMQRRLYQRSVSGDDEGNVTYGFKLDTLSTKKLKQADFVAALKKINSSLLAKEEKDADAYDYGQYTAYEVTLKNGQRYLLDRRLSVDGKGTGYYLIPDGKQA